MSRFSGLFDPFAQLEHEARTEKGLRIHAAVAQARAERSLALEAEHWRTLGRVNALLAASYRAAPMFPAHGRSPELSPLAGVFHGGAP